MVQPFLAVDKKKQAFHVLGRIGYLALTMQKADFCPYD